MRYLSIFFTVALAILSTSAKATNIKCTALFQKEQTSGKSQPSFSISDFLPALPPNQIMSDIAMILPEHSQGQTLGHLFESSAGVSEGYSIREHNTLVFAEMDSQLPFLLKRIPQFIQDKLNLVPLLRFAIVFHDIGKPLAIAAGNKDDQHYYTSRILLEMSSRFGLSPFQRDFVMALVSNDILGHFIKGEKDAESTRVEIMQLTNSANIDLSSYFTLQEFFYTIDAASYPNLKAKVFYQTPDGSLEVVSKAFRDLRKSLAIGENSSSATSYLPGERLADLKASASLILRQHKLVSKMVSTAGYDSIEKLKSELEKSKEGRLAIHLLEDEEALQFAMNRPPEARDFILRYGFQTVHQTGLTRGGATHDGSIAFRTAAEASSLAMTGKEYHEMGPSRKALFGYVRPNPKTGVRKGLVGYGSDTYIFNRKELEPYLTLSPGDSLNRWRDAQGMDAVASTTRVSFPLQSWDQLFIPWQDRMLIAPFIGLQNSYESNGKNIQIFQVKTFPSIKLRPTLYPILGDYLEWQGWRVRSDISMLEAFEFVGEPPSGEFLKALRDNNVKIFDARNNEDIREWIHDGYGLARNPDWPPQYTWPPKPWPEPPYLSNYEPGEMTLDTESRTLFQLGRSYNGIVWRVFPKDGRLPFINKFYKSQNINTFENDIEGLKILGPILDAYPEFTAAKVTHIDRQSMMMKLTDHRGHTLAEVLKKGLLSKAQNKKVLANYVRLLNTVAKELTKDKSQVIESTISLSPAESASIYIRLKSSKLERGYIEFLLKPENVLLDLSNRLVVFDPF